MVMGSTMIKDNSQIRREAKEHLKGNWLMAILLCVVFGLISGLPGMIPIVGVVVSIVVAGPLMLGLVSCFLNLVRNNSFNFENLFDGFNNFLPAFLVYLLSNLFTFLWSLLLLIPGIIAALKYSMAVYILHDNPQMSAMEAINASKKMIQGHKWRLFCMYLSIFGWIILASVVSLIGYIGLIALGEFGLMIAWGILSAIVILAGSLMITPYLNTVLASFYENLRENQVY